jgi:hypothetical protein
MYHMKQNCHIIVTLLEVSIYVQNVIIWIIIRCQRTAHSKTKKKKIKKFKQKHLLHLWVWLQELSNIRTVLFLCLFTCHHFWRILGLQENKLYIKPHYINIYFILKQFNNGNTQKYTTFFNICTCPAAHLVISMTLLSVQQQAVCRQVTVSLPQPCLSTFKWCSVRTEHHLNLNL